MKNIKNFGNATLVSGGCLTIILMLIFYPIIVFWGGYFGGWILLKFVGELVIEGFNTVFNRNVLTINNLPIICGTFAVFGQYFKASQTNNSK